MRKYLIILSLLLALGLCAVDLALPLSIAFGITYVGVVLISAWASQRWAPLLIAVVCTGLIIVDFSYPVMVMSFPNHVLWKALLNRFLILSALWITTLLVLWWRRVETSLEEQVRERTAALQHANDQLHSEIVERQQAQEALQGLNETLSQRIAERTAALTQANAALQAELFERKRTEDHLRAQQEALLQREKLAAMGFFLANVAHELNNPLAIVMMEADLLREETAGTPLAAHSAKMLDAVQRCERIIRGFLALANQSSREPRQIQLNTIVTGIIDLMSHSFHVDNIAVELHLDDDLPQLWADPNQLHQAVMHLISNAHQALVESPSRRRLRLTTRFDPAHSRVLLEVADSGVGISPDLQARIFDPFYTTRELGSGVGLGLALCERIVTGHGGTVQVQSQLGHGSRFMVALPVRSGAALQPSLQPQTPSPSQSQTILLGSHAPSIAQALTIVLHRAGYNVETVGNGRHALAMLQKRSFGVILCDLHLPEVNGLELYRELATHRPHLARRIALLIDKDLSPETETSLAQVNIPYLSGPLRAAAVRQVVRQLIQTQ